MLLKPFAKGRAWIRQCIVDRVDRDLLVSQSQFDSFGPWTDAGGSHGDVVLSLHRALGTHDFNPM